MTLTKEDAKTGYHKAQGAATLDGAVYELRRTADDQLIKEVTIKKMEQQLFLALILDDYY